MDQTSDCRIELGRRGESLAADYLRRCGWRIRERNYEVDIGEIDLIAERSIAFDGADVREIAFVEVKTRRGGPETPEMTIGAHKRRTIARVARIYLDRDWAGPTTSRFDVITVDLEGEPPDLCHYRAAFDALGRLN
jgi:putative endonuclease